MRNPILVALDVPTAEAALKLVEQLAPVSGGFKIGSELFTAAGPDIVRRIRGLGAPVFLDLKLHDIPNTVANAAVESARLKLGEAIDQIMNTSPTSASGARSAVNVQPCGFSFIR